MKRRKLSKKLLLNKETVAHLNREELDSVRGGFDTWVCTYFDDSCIHSPSTCTTFLMECPIYTTTNDN